jgi:O-antigen ligase
MVAATALMHMSLSLWMDRLVSEPADGDRRSTVPHVTLGRALWLGALLTATGAIVQRWLEPAWLSGEPWIGLRRSVGLMGDANPMGFVTATWAPLTAAFFPMTGVAGILSASGALVLWIAAWFSGARSALILIGAALLAGATGAVARRSWAWRLSIGLAGAGAVVALMAGWQSGPETPLGRLRRSLPHASPGDALYEVLWRRDGYGLAAVEAIREHPIAGVGIGRFQMLSTGYHQRATGRAIPPDNAQNLWRHQLAEQGIIGLLPLLFMTIRAIRDIWAGRDGPVALRWMLLGIGAALIVGYPLQDPAAAVTVATLVAMQGRVAGAARGPR